MSRSPHRFRADPAEVWKTLLFGEIVRAVDRDVTVREDRSIRLPRSGHWESGLARIRPALDDALGATALAVAWRWACAEFDANAWPGLELVARKATDRAVQSGPMQEMARFAGGGGVIDGGGSRCWSLWRDGRCIAAVGVDGVEAPPEEIDRTAAILAAWLDAEVRRSDQSFE